MAAVGGRFSVSRLSGTGEGPAWRWGGAGSLPDRGSGWAIAGTARRSSDVPIPVRSSPSVGIGTGEAAQGPAAAALANALASAVGVRIRELPLTSKRVKAAIGV